MQSSSFFQSLRSSLKKLGKQHRLQHQKSFQRAVAAVSHHAKSDDPSSVMVIQGNDLQGQLSRLLQANTGASQEMVASLLAKVKGASYTQAQLLALQRELSLSDRLVDKIASAFIQEQFTGWNSPSDHVILCLTQASAEAARNLEIDAVRILTAQINDMRNQAQAPL